MTSLLEPPTATACRVYLAAAERVAYEPGSTGVLTSATEAWRLRRGCRLGSGTS